MNTNLSRFLQKCLPAAVVYFLFLPILLAQEPSDSLPSAKKHLQDSLIKSGYWEAKVFSDSKNGTEIQKGRLYVWDKIQVVEKGNVIHIPKIRRLETQPANQYFLKEKLQHYIDKEYHRKGYPFAKATIEIRGLQDNEVTATVHIVKKNFIVYDSLEVNQSAKGINEQYLSHALQMDIGEPFDSKAFEGVLDKLKQFGFISSNAAPQLYFANDKAKVQLDIESEATNQFDAIVGIIPTESGTNFTGQVDIRLRNLFRRAVGFDIYWQKYAARSQLLEARLQQPYAFRSLIGLDLGFQLLQEDSTFLQTELTAGIMYPISSFWKVGLAYQQKNSNILREFSETEVDKLSPMRSSKVNALKLSVLWNEPLHHPQPKDYSYAQFNTGLGTKQVLNFNSLPQEWQNVEERTINLTASVKLHHQKMLGKRFLVEAIGEYAAIENEAIARNDLLRLGGLQNLRGFDQNYFYTSNYGLLNLNYRYFLDRQSSFFLLTDGAYLQPQSEWVYAMGAGADIKSKNGWFRIIYALGASEGNPPDFSLGKIHFGYIAIF